MAMKAIQRQGTDQTEEEDWTNAMGIWWIDTLEPLDSAFAEVRIKKQGIPENKPYKASLKCK